MNYWSDTRGYQPSTKISPLSVMGWPRSELVMFASMSITA
jgi:hypothetical protein